MRTPRQPSGVAANAADDLTMDRFEAGELQIETKPDLTPVSDADLGASEK